MPSDGFGFGPVSPPPPAVLPITLVPSTATPQTGVFQSQPGQAPPTQPPIPTAHLHINELPSLTETQKLAILAHLTLYQQQGYPYASWIQLNADDQALLTQAGIQPQAAPPPAPASSNTGEVIALVTVVGLAGVAAWYFWVKK
jgi:hypothetical protein